MPIPKNPCLSQIPVVPLSMRTTAMQYGRNHNFLASEEAAEWFDTHDIADYEDQLTPVDVEFDLRKNRNWVELDEEIAKYLRELAKAQHVSTRTLVNEFLKEKLSSLQ
jgi:hypothetical protein